VTDTPTPIEAKATDPGGDMIDGVTRAHLETPDEMAATPTDIEVEADGTLLTQIAPASVVTDDEPISLVTSYKQQHAKVLRFEISVGKDDDATTIEQFEFLIREALEQSQAQGVLRYHNVTLQGGYYIIDGKVCLPGDYDPVSRNRKPGTYPPSWAGGPTKGREKDWLQEHAAPVVAAPELVEDETASPVRTSDTSASKADTVKALGAGINLKVKRGQRR
jgi:hypothetical protein